MYALHLDSIPIPSALQPCVCIPDQEIGNEKGKLVFLLANFNGSNKKIQAKYKNDAT